MSTTKALARLLSRACPALAHQNVFVTNVLRNASAPCCSSPTLLVRSLPNLSSSSRGFASDAATKASSNEETTLELTDAAVKRMERLKAKTQDPLEASNLALRVLVDPGGCSGFQYRFELASRDTAGEEDVLVERGGLTVICDRVSLELLKGAKIDYQEDMMRAAFVIGENPNATQSCGCGSSFATKS